jgi:signal transduction histidine kinase
MRDITERVRSEEERARAEEVLRQHAERLRTLRDIDQAICSTLALPEVLDQLTRALTMTLGINRCSIWLLDESDEFLQGRGYGAQPGEPDVESIRIPRTEPMVARLFETGQPLMVPDVNDPAYANVINTEYTTAFHIRAFLAVPLVLRDRVTGLLVLDDTRTARIFQPEEIRLAQSVATQAAIAIENARLFEEVRAGREQLRNLTGYLQTAREEERAYIAREIHDEFGQALTALKMDLAWLTKRLPAGSLPLAEKAGDMSDLIDSTIQTVRRVATELRPGLLDDLGLAAAIEWQAQELTERTGINCELYLGDEDIVLERDLATAIFRIFQETLTNVARHAEATEVRVELEDSPDELVLIVRDNGKGIAPSQVADPRSLGLIGMRERAHSWGGDVTFQSLPGQGTVVTVRAPRPDTDFGELSRAEEGQK